ncbi:MAG: hypothetical protein WAR78_11365, partial [Ferruginibacter sp.]
FTHYNLTQDTGSEEQDAGFNKIGQGPSRISGELHSYKRNKQEKCCSKHYTGQSFILMVH